MQQPAGRPQGDFDRTIAQLRTALRPRYAIPGGVIGVVLLLAFLVQPGATTPAASDEFDASLDLSTMTATAESTPTASASTTMALPTATVGEQSVAGADAGASPTDEVAGARSTPSATATEAPSVSTEQCGDLQEASFALAVEQTLSGIAVQATRASVYPIDYLRCLMLATGGSEARALASALEDAERDGSTHVAIIDLWVTNGSRNFAQLALNTATISAAGQTFPVMGTVGGGAETVVASGKGRAVTVIGVITHTLTPNTGPITLSIEGPRIGGEQVPGKYQLFLPTP